LPRFAKCSNTSLTLSVKRITVIHSTYTHYAYYYCLSIFAPTAATTVNDNNDNTHIDIKGISQVGQKLDSCPCTADTDDRTQSYRRQAYDLYGDGRVKRISDFTGFSWCRSGKRVISQPAVKVVSDKYYTRVRQQRHKI